jgi:drug/metabolite transporter (DMT)-like permease
VRVALAAATLILIASAMTSAWPSRRDAIALLLLGVLGNGVYQILFIQGIAHTRAGNAALVLAATPAFVALGGWIRRIERIRMRGVLGIAVSFAGIALVVMGSAPVGADASTLFGDVLVLGGCVCWAIFTVLLKPYTSRIDAVKLSAITMVGGMVPLLVIATPSIATTRWSGVAPVVWGAIVFSGIGALVVAYLCWYRGVRVLGPTRTAMYGNLQPVFALVFAWILLQEVPTVAQGMGAAGILGGLLLTRT